MNAAMTPIKGTCLSPSDLFVREMAMPRVMIVIAQQISETVRLRKLSGICMGTGEYNI
jgi:hypothetical protein